MPDIAQCYGITPYLTVKQEMGFVTVKCTAVCDEATLVSSKKNLPAAQNHLITNIKIINVNKKIF